MKTIFIISGKKYILKYTRKMSEKEVIKMKSFITHNGEKLLKTVNFKINKFSDKDKERLFDINL
tara:strand:- start:334 stop:525 length:192 start_codon:yes stop_codon:yes gene_type:complete